MMTAFLTLSSTSLIHSRSQHHGITYPTPLITPPTAYFLPLQQSRYHKTRCRPRRKSLLLLPSPSSKNISRSCKPQKPFQRSTTTACEPRPENAHSDPSFLPQTIEYAVEESKRATRDALLAGFSNLRVELPMGRSRSHWYVMSPIGLWYPEVSIIAFHYAEMFTGMNISLILGTGPGVTHPVPWISDLRRLEDESPHKSNPAPSVASSEESPTRNSFVPTTASTFQSSSPSLDTSPLSSSTEMDATSFASKRVVIFAGISSKQYDMFEERLQEEMKDAEAVILFCSFLDAPLSKRIPHPSIKCQPFQTVYFCRAFSKVSILKDAYDAPWSVFVEIAIFEYEWVGDKPDSDGWIPSQETIELFVSSRGARQKKASAYFVTDYSQCEAGFWPFMTICSRNVLPLSGVILKREAKEKEKKKSKPFGFF